MTDPISRGPDAAPVRRALPFAAKGAIAAPYLWLIGFFLVPFGIVLKISLSQTAIAQTPYLPGFDAAGGWSAFREFVSGLSIANYLTLASHHLYVLSYLKSLEVAAVSTV